MILFVLLGNRLIKKYKQGAPPEFNEFPLVSGFDQLSEQPAFVRSREGVRPSLQHGPRRRQRNVDGKPKDRKR